MSWFRRKPRRAGYFWLVVHQLSDGTVVSTWGTTYIDEGSAAMTLLHEALDAAEKKRPSMGQEGGVPISFTVLPARL